MSDVEKRQTQQRAISIAACAAALAVGGPLIGYRFDLQKSGEAYSAGVAQLGAELAKSRTDRAPPEGAHEPWLKTVSYSFENHANRLTFTGGYGDLTAGEVDADTLSTLAIFDARQMNAAEREQRELNCLAEAVYYEARSEGPEGQMAVAEVVMNRVRDSRFPKTVCGVVYQGRYRETGCQFTFTCDGSLRFKPFGLAWDRAKAVALHVRMGLNKPVTNNATHYHTDYVNPYWAAGLIETAEVGSHIFYRFPKGAAEWSRVRLARDAQDRRQADLITISGSAVSDGLPAEQPVAPANAMVTISAPAQGAALGAAKAL